MKHTVVNPTAGDVVIPRPNVPWAGKTLQCEPHTVLAVHTALGDTVLAIYPAKAFEHMDADGRSTLAEYAPHIDLADVIDHQVSCGHFASQHGNPDDIPRCARGLTTPIAPRGTF